MADKQAFNPFSLSTDLEGRGGSADLPASSFGLEDPLTLGLQLKMLLLVALLP